MRALSFVALISTSLVIAGCGSGSDSASVSQQLAATAVPAAASTPAGTDPAGVPPTVTPAAKGAKVKQGVCSNVQAPGAKSPDVPKPTGKLSASDANTVTMKTSCGTIVIALDAKNNEVAANAVAWLVKHKYYDATVFHRIVPGFVVQGGDPSGDGTGGPSWSVVDKPKSSATYPVGTLAMAKTSADPDGTVGSQFFIMTGGSLPPQYAIAGKVTSGMNAVSAMEKLGAGQGSDGPPSRPIELIKATFSAK